MSDRFPFIQTHDIVPCYDDRYDWGSDVAYSDFGNTITLKNTDHVACLVWVNLIETTSVSKRLSFQACTNVAGSDATLIEPIYYREKINDGSDTWGAVQTIADGYFDISDSGACPSTSDYHCFLFEFEAAEIWTEGVAAAGGSDSYRHDCMRMSIASTDTDGSDCFLSAFWILHPLRYSNQAATSTDNWTD